VGCGHGTVASDVFFALFLAFVGCPGKAG